MSRLRESASQSRHSEREVALDVAIAPSEPVRSTTRMPVPIGVADESVIGVRASPGSRLGAASTSDFLTHEETRLSRNDALTY